MAPSNNMHPGEEGSSSDDERRVGGALVTGASGLVGGLLLPELAERFAWVRTLSRSGARARIGIDARSWDGLDPGPAALDGVDTIVHLAGEPIFGGMPTAARLGRIRASRVRSTHQIVERILERSPEERPRVLICASAVGIYDDSGDERLDERSEVGSGFLAEVCRDWEGEALRAEEAGLRVVSVRIGVVLAKEGGALGLMRIPFSLGLGGRLGSGRQFFPWIHGEDLARVILFCIEKPIEGVVNAVAPESVRNVDLTRELAAVLSRPAVLPVPAFVLRAVLGEISGELLGSRRVVPSVLEANGFEFEHPKLRGALEATLR